MSKYGSGFLSIEDVSELEIQEVSEILKRYKVPREERKAVIGTIKQVYYMLTQSYDAAEILERKLEEMGVNTGALVIERLAKREMIHSGD
jgi:hypothetical protein|uniref:Uncharacterized protein n=1 Tax=Siphoviridae sp. ctVqj4 TaxID=2826359 RepID=A0A8S5NLG7_9CAUD|nr:MAG TPA: hypothetical protein [Siphoviridae sp. ctVqj4]